MANFTDLPDSTRLGFRRELERSGGSLLSYNVDGSVTINLPRLMDQIEMCRETCAQFGLSLTDQWHYFPLGSDPAPLYQRHDGLYPGSRGFWLRARVEVRQ